MKRLTLPLLSAALLFPAPLPAKPATKPALQRERAVRLADETPETFLGRERVITLDRAFERALGTDQSIRLAYTAIRRANLQPWRALTILGPQLSANMSYQSNARRTQTDPLPDYTRLDTVNRSAGITFVQPLFDPTVVPAYRYGQLAARSARLQYQYTIRETLFGVAQAYYNVLKQQKLVEVNKLTERLAQEQLDQAQARYDVGDVARIDVLRAQATLEDARNQTILATGSLEIAKNTLSNILNLGGDTNFTLREPEKFTIPDLSYDSALKEAFANREDLKISRISVEQERASRNQLIASYSPRISVQASSQWGSSTGPGSGRNEAQTGVINVQVPILTGGQREIDIRNAGHLIREAEIRVENTAKAIETDVRVAWINVTTGQKSLEALSASVAASEQNYQDTKNQYEAGTATSLDVQMALKELSNARTMLANQFYDLQIALRDFERAKATLEQERVHKKSGLPLIQR